MFKKYTSLLNKDRLCFLVIRSKSSKASKETTKDKALEYFDDLYGKIFDKSWPSIRLGLLSQPKYVAVLNNYSDKDKAATFLESHGAININKLFEYENTTISERKKQRKTKSDNLNEKFVKISEEKFEEEISDLYPSESSVNTIYSNDGSDRFIDPSVSTSSLNEYVPATKIKGSSDYLPESQHYSYYSDNSNFTANILDESNLMFPEHLSVYSYEPGNIQSFPRPKSGSTGVSDYYLMDGGSLLPVLALDIQPEDTVLDMCAAPGGKSFLCLQTLHPKTVTCNDISLSRLRRIKSVLKEFFYDYKKMIADNEIQLTHLDARQIDAVGIYNKILVDVPCTTDRHSVIEDDNNIFKSTRLKERIKIPELQSEILMQALKIVAVGGTVVYSTCSLSPIQNDGVVHMALKRIHEETDCEIVVMNMREALQHTKILYRYSNVDLRYGHLIVPYIASKETTKDKALEYFDDLYGKIFDKSWPSIRLGLLSQPKYVAVLNNYSDKDKAATFLESHGAININKLFEYENTTISERKKQRKTKSDNLNEKFVKISEEKFEEEISDLYPSESSVNTIYSNDGSDRFIDPSVSTSSLNEYVPATKIKGSSDYLPESQHYSYYSDNSNFTANILDESNLMFPEHLSVYSYEPGNIQSFPRPKSGSTGVSDYYLMDEGSLLPVLALDIQPEDTVLDMCAAPGGKSFLCLQTLHPKTVTCNDISLSRLRRIKSVLKEFFYDYKKMIADNEIQLTHLDARQIDAVGIYNKILVDVPCTTDRHSVIEDDNNIFKSTRLKERIKIPELQSEILMQALKIVAVGGTVVYSTCSLSPIQNDGVVHMALKRIHEETDCEIVVMNMREALQHTKILYRYSNVDLRYGHLIVPYIVSNFGPMYFCKMVRLK